MSETNELGAALAKAQLEMSNPKFDKTNPHFRNKFASLAAVRDAVIPILAKHGIACIQELEAVDGGVACTTVLMHSSGQVYRTPPLRMPVSKADAQGFGSSGTYARRYSLMAVANVVGDEDDDANAGTGKPAQATDIQKWDHKPMGDTEVTMGAKLYASNFQAAFDNNDVVRGAQLYNDLNSEGEEASRNAWALVPSNVRAWVKKAVAATKAA
jgi:hypothetical protein